MKNSNLHSVHATADGVESPDMVWKVLSAVAKHATTQRDYATAEKYLQQSLSVASESFGTNDLRLAIILLECADLSALQNDPKHSRSFNHQAKRIIENHLSGESLYKTLGH